LRFEVFDISLLMDSREGRRSATLKAAMGAIISIVRQRSVSVLMDGRNVRIGETGLEQLIQWLRQTGKPQSLETLTERYVAILRELVQVEEGS
jgi:hypothetical protein